MDDLLERLKLESLHSPERARFMREWLARAEEEGRRHRKRCTEKLKTMSPGLYRRSDVRGIFILLASDHRLLETGPRLDLNRTCPQWTFKEDHPGSRSRT